MSQQALSIPALTYFHATTATDGQHVLAMKEFDGSYITEADNGVIARVARHTLVLGGDLSLFDDTAERAAWVARLERAAAIVQHAEAANDDHTPAAFTPLPPALYDAVERIAAHAAQAPGLCPTRFAKARELALSGGVFLVPDTYEALVRGSKHATYRVSRTCECADYLRGTHACKHRIAVKLLRRGLEALEIYAAALKNADLADASEAVTASISPTPLPEAPVSANVRVYYRGLWVQWTLRGTDETAVAARLDAILDRFQAQPA